MACPDRISNTCTVNTPPDPVTTFVRHRFKQDNVVRFVIDGPPNGSIACPRLIGHWVVEAKCGAGGTEFSVAIDSEEFDGCDTSEYPMSPTNQDIGGPTLTLEYDT